MSRSLDLLVGGTLGAWALRNAPLPLVNQVVCLDDDLIALAAELGYDIFAGDPHAAAFFPGRAALSVHFPLILDAALVARYDGAIWAVHPGLLPFGRGMHAVFWALWQGTPAGATLHELVPDLNAGPIVDRREVAIWPSDTGERLNDRVLAAERGLLARWLPRLATGARPPATPQPAGGTRHTRADFELLCDEIRFAPARAQRERLERCLTYPRARIPAPERW